MKRSKFSLSHYHLTTMLMGKLVPIGCTEVLPGDTVQHATSALVRCAPLVTPPMHPCHARIHHWFVPNRIIWEDWEDFITGGDDGMDASVFPTITIPIDGVNDDTLACYLGVPMIPNATGGLEVSALPFRAYNLIYNEWYRDQDLSPELTIDLTSGPDTTTNFADTLRVAWEKDYFTTSRPWEQKGPAVPIPLENVTNGDLEVQFFDNVFAEQTLQRTAATANSPVQVTETGAIGPLQAYGLDTASVIQMAIPELRAALAIQRYEEARARYGSRYTEYLRYLGVKSSDARLQRPEYLGGGKQTVQFSEVLSTNFDSGTSNPGQFGGHGIAAMRSNRYRRFFEEHGFIISMMYVLPKSIYANMLERHWNRRTKEDFWQRELEHIGQQEVLLKEIDANVPTGTGAGQQDFVFGFQDRYDEYRRRLSRVSGAFLDNTLDTWHFARHFAPGSPPTLNDDFISAVPSVLPFADQEAPTLYVMANHNMQARRLVSNNATPFVR